MAFCLSPRFFSLTSILLTSSFLAAITVAIPIPRALDATTALSSKRFDVLSIKPRFSTIDNFWVGVSTTPATRSTRLMPRNFPVIEPLLTLLPPPPPRQRVSRRSLSSTLETQEPTTAPIPAVSRRQTRQQARSSTLGSGTFLKGDAVSGHTTRELVKEDINSREAAPKASPEAHNSFEYSPIGATKMFTGKLWRRELKRTPIA